VRGPRATGTADISVVAALAEPPQIIHGPVAGERQLGGVVPDLLERLVADVSAGVPRGG
jgi:hypothetical protein